MWISPVSPDLCLNFANTLAWRGRAEPSEEITNLPALTGWLAKAVGASAFSETEAWARAHPKKAAAVLEDAIALREVIYRTFRALAGGAQPDRNDIAAINAAHAKAPPRRVIEPGPSGYGWVIGGGARTAPELLAPVLWSAGDLVVNAGGVNVRQCANEKCLWLFVDASRNGARRWCDMSSCGNRAKAERHYRKSKQA